MTLHSFRLLIGFAVLLITGNVNAADSAESWPTLIKKSSMREVAAKMVEAKPAWPAIRSTFYVSKLPAPQKDAETKALAVAHELHAKLAATMRSPQSAAGNLEEQLDTLSRIADQLRRAGGYSNLVLADSAERLVILHVADWVIANPSDAPKARAAIKKHAAAAGFDLKQVLVSLVDEDPYLDDKRAEVAKVDGNKAIYEALTPIGIGMKDVLSAMQLEQRTTGRLLNKPSAVALVVRMAETNALRNVHLAGLLAFFEKGGRIDELDAANESAFEKRMGKDTRSFRSSPLQIRYLSSEHLLALIQMHAASNVRASFLAAALD